MDMETMKYLAAAISMAGAAGPVAVAEAWIAQRAVEGMARNPEVAPKLQTAMILGMAITESTAIYSLVLSLIILFV